MAVATLCLRPCSNCHASKHDRFEFRETAAKSDEDYVAVG
jgi:hypothetical protein